MWTDGCRRYFLCILLLSSCNIKDTSVFLQNVIPLNGNTIEIDYFVGHPHEIVCVGSLLLFSDPYENQTLSIFDTKNNQSIGRFLATGRGPGEVIQPVRLFVTSDNKLCVYQPNGQCLSIFSVPEMIEQDKISFNNMSNQIRKTKNHYIGIGNYENGRFMIFDHLGNPILNFGKYPFRGKDMDNLSRLIIYQGHICANPFGDYFVMGSEFCDNLEFYKVENNSGVLLKKYETFDANVQFVNQRLHIDDKTFFAYRWIYGTEKYCYMLYSGKSNNGNKKKHIIVFDWLGNHIKTYKSDVNIITFCVDESDETLFGVVLKDEYEIMSFKL